MSTAHPPSSFVLPPSERDLEVFESVARDGLSLRAAAERHDLSVTRIRQLVSRVTAWLADTLPPETDISRERQLQLARHLAADRLHHAYGQLLDLWRTTSNPTYLARSIRFSLAMARLGVVPGAIDSLLADAWEQATSTHPVARIQNPKPEIQNPSPPPLPEDCAPRLPPPAQSVVPNSLTTEPKPRSTNALPSSPSAGIATNSKHRVPLRAASAAPHSTSILGTMEPQHPRARFLRNLPCET